jgi:hypothetical protein
MKYCSVGATLSTGITEIHHAYLLRGGDGSEQTAEVIVLGPGEDLVAVAELDRPVMVAPAG